MTPETCRLCAMPLGGAAWADVVQGGRVHIVCADRKSRAAYARRQHAAWTTLGVVLACTVVTLTMWGLSPACLCFCGGIWYTLHVHRRYWGDVARWLMVYWRLSDRRQP